MLRLAVEEKTWVPLAHTATRRAVEEVIASAKTLDEAAASIRVIRGLGTYKGGSHVAIHARISGGLTVTRFGIVTDDGGPIITETKKGEVPC